MRTLVPLGRNVRLAAFALLLTACGGGATDPTVAGGNGGGGGGGGSGGGSTSSSLTVNNNYFSPASTTVAPGTMVTWTWNACGGAYGDMCTNHQIVFGDGAPGSDVMSTGTFSRTFTTGGTYPYHCAIHGLAMSGTIHVQQ